MAGVAAHDKTASTTLYYWPNIPGRGEFVRLALEEAQIDYYDIARDENGGGVQAIYALLQGTAPHSTNQNPVFAPPALFIDGKLLYQTSNILLALAKRNLGKLVPDADEHTLDVANQLQCLITDFVAETHDTHHPIAVSLYYKDQLTEAKRRAHDFCTHRIPKFLSFFERQVAHSRGPYLLGAADRFCYVDLSLAHTLLGLEYAFPVAFKRATESTPLILALRDAVLARPNIKAYRESERCLPFNEDGVFRRYPELDLEEEGEGGTRKKQKK
ncbi:glutathione S-transferase, partial [Gonapodya prolifera JEL478]